MTNLFTSIQTEEQKKKYPRNILVSPGSITDVDDIDVVASINMKKYFKALQQETFKCYDLAKKARSRHYDPDDDVEIVIARNMAERVVGLISVVAPQIKGSGVVERIMELEKQYGALDWRVAMKISEEVAKEQFCKFTDKKEAIEVGIRVGFAYSTVGVVSSPLDGFIGLDIKSRLDGKGEFFCLNYAGPIRNAGGTNAALSVLIADYVRRKLGYSVYDPDEKEKKRTYTELQDYNERVTNLQYNPYEEEIYYLMEHMPVEIGGDPSEKIEVSNFKDLPRIKTNFIRSGFCLIMSSCVPLKAQKLWAKLSKWGNEFEMDQWNFLEKYLKLQKELKSKQSSKKEVSKEESNSEQKEKPKILPDFTFVSELIAGRPVIGHPMAKGAFRLRYGRARTSGYSGQAINPATMHVLDNFIATGTQLKIERPGKGAAFTPCDSIEGPIVKLNDGSVLFLDTDTDAKRYSKDVQEILFLGDVLINYGDFLDRGHILVPCGYNEEWYVLEFKKALAERNLTQESLSEITKIKTEILKDIVTNAHASKKYSSLIYYILSKTLDIPMHPRYTIHYVDVSIADFKLLLGWLKHAELIFEELPMAIKDNFTSYDGLSINDNYKIKLQLKDNAINKRTLELLGLPHQVINNEFVIIDSDFSRSFVCSLGLKCIFDSNVDSGKLFGTIGHIEPKEIDALADKIGSYKTPFEMVAMISDIKFRDKSGTYIGGRMGRPEKAKMRKMQGSPHGLFPIGEEGGKTRSMINAIEKGIVNAEFSNFVCEGCGIYTPYRICLECGKDTKKLELTDNCNIRELVKQVSKKYGVQVNKLVKGVKGTINEEHNPEFIAKALLRSNHDVYVNKDGTIRYDVSELTCTHFKPKEIGVSIEKLKGLGYSKDVYHNELIDDNQVLEIMPQDVILPSCPDSPDEGADIVLIRATQFIDDLLTTVYGLDPYYGVKTRDDLIGHLIIGLAPHTSAGMIGRIVGFSKTQGFLAHPYYHAAERRDTDGDEIGFLLLLDGFLNFSKKYLGKNRGSTMDAPLVLTTVLRPTEVDDMAFNVDTVSSYPLELYEAAQQYKAAWEVKVTTIKNLLNTEAQYEHMMFTHDTDNINKGILCSAYKTLPSMQEKLDGQLSLAKKIRAVDAQDVARLVIEKHFLKDLKGNLRQFSMQKFRCSNCNESYRRPPLYGKCLKCDGKLIFTISEGSVIKYLEPSLRMAEEFDVSPYLKQTLELLKMRIDDVFGKESEKQVGLNRFFC